MKAIGWILILILLAVVFGFMGHALWQFCSIDELTGGSTVLTIIIVGCVVITALVAAALLRLAFWSSKKGYDERVEFDLHAGDDAESRDN